MWGLPIPFPISWVEAEPGHTARQKSASRLGVENMGSTGSITYPTLWMWKIIHSKVPASRKYVMLVPWRVSN